ncbi:sterol carrier protein 2 [Blyttiomyces sp. JEL0837]|nr:sterol carrier protein 2 [Blyttiomyces sp. JEL0837]
MSTPKSVKGARKVYVIGVGMTHFDKPGRRTDVDYPDYALEAATKALLDANITYDSVETAAVGYCFGDSTCGQRALYQLGLTQIPIVNVNNSQYKVFENYNFPCFKKPYVTLTSTRILSKTDCSTGSSALFMARNAVAFGQAECALALGFEKMAPGSLGTVWNDRTNPMDKSVEQMVELRGFDKAPFAAQIFANAGLEYVEKYGGSMEAFDVIASKSHTQSTLNPYSQFKQPATVEQVHNARKIFGPLTLLHCSPTSDGAACAIVASEDFVIKHGLGPQAIEIAAQALATDSPACFDPLEQKKSCIEVAGADMTRRAVADIYKATGVTPKDIDVVELHDCFSANELITYDALGLCEPGKAADFTMSGATFHPIFWKGPRPARNVVVNPSGGLISKGHPLGATGLAQCSELTWQLRGWAGKRQVNNAKLALQHNIGLGGAAVVTLYQKPASLPKPSAYQDPRERFGYNPAVECRGITEADVRRVMSKNGSLAGTPKQLKEEWADKLKAKAPQANL